MINTRCIFYLYSTANSGHACTATSIKFFSEHEKGEKNEKTKRNSCPDSDLTYPYPNLLRPLNSATRSEVHKPRLNYRQTKNPHESHRQRVDGATLVTENTQAGTFNTTRSNSTTRAFRPFFFVFIFFSFFFWLRRREKKKKHSKNAYELNDGSLSLSDSYSAVRSAQRPAR